MFRGFEQNFPAYEVETCQTHTKFNVRSMTVQDEEKLKTSLVSPTKVTENLNSVLFNCIIDKPTTITDYESFLKNVTLKDRDVIIFGLFLISYEEVRNYSVHCKECRKEFPITIKAADTFNITPYPMDDILTKTMELQLPLMKEMSIILFQPTLKDEIDILKNYSSRAGMSIELLTETLMIKGFKQKKKTDKDPEDYTDRVDIIDIYRSLPSKDKKFIHSNYQSLFGKYCLDLKMKAFCTSCGTEQEVAIDLVQQLFSNILE